MNTRNPFVLSGYISSEYFCDREKETAQILSAIKNQRNLTLISFRRMGKTGLIHHVFNEISNKKGISYFYIDIQNTLNLTEFTKEFAKSIIGKFDSIPEKILQNLGKLFSSLKPSVSYDSFTGEPKINIEINSNKEAENSLTQIFDYLHQQKGNIIIAIDEFQQILNYPEKNIEALLRKYIQNSPNVNFIFSGSNKHMLISMFNDHSKPFYQSTEMLYLDTINLEHYQSFILKKFLDSNKKISEIDIEFLLKWTKQHTFYVQFICNRLFSLNTNSINLKLIKQTMKDILDENKPVFNNYRNLLTFNQWNLLRAIAAEDVIKQITSSQFINKYKLGTPSSVASALKVLIEKEMVYQIEHGYRVTDLFLSRWLESSFI